MRLAAIGMADARRIRELAGVARARAADRAGVSDVLARLYEANRDAVSPQVRAALDAVYAELLIEVRQRVDELGSWPPGPELGLDHSRLRA